jgi:hypothetical protein
VPTKILNSLIFENFWHIRFYIPWNLFINFSFIFQF